MYEHTYVKYFVHFIEYSTYIFILYEYFKDYSMKVPLKKVMSINI